VPENEKGLAARSVGKPAQIASWRHLAGFFLIVTALVALGFYSQAAKGPAGVQSGDLAKHSAAIGVYLTAIVMDFAFLYYCWAGVHRYGGKLTDLSGGRWNSCKEILRDIAIAAPFWVVWEATAYGVHRLMGDGGAKSVDTLLPQTGAEILLWIALSMTAGFCEELVFRGNLQQQLRALTSVSAAVIGQGVVFGLAHSYQGWRQVVVISVLGVLYGVLAAWRKKLWVNVMSHAFTDVWEGWLKFVLWLPYAR
jgi:membrane protease YdiL (CAAX protease family)